MEPIWRTYYTSCEDKISNKPCSKFQYMFILFHFIKSVGGGLSTENSQEALDRCHDEEPDQTGLIS